METIVFNLPSITVHMPRFLGTLLLYLLAIPLISGESLHEYAIVLDQPAVAARISRKDLRSTAAVDASARIASAQQSLRQKLAAQKIRVTGSASVLVNAVFIRATEEQARALAGIGGVRRVERMMPIKRNLDKAIELTKVPQAWSLVGGEGNAGAGVKIGILDTGIDQNHPAFQDQSLSVPPGFPKGRPQDLAFTNNKVIVARSYVAQLPFAEVDPVDSRPDDTTPRDRVGHGTAAAMIAAGRRVRGPAAEITGVAPKAWLGNYKIFGSPGVNDTTKAPVLINALEDALADGMDIVTLSIGTPAGFGALDRCTNNSGGEEACDIRADAVENAVRAGLTVVVAAGNDGDYGLEFPTRGTIHSPGTAPSAITVGASTNSHIYYAGVRVTGDDVPQSLQRIDALFGNGPKPAPTLQAPLRDVTTVGDNGLACAPLGNNTLTGTIALLQRGTCAFAEKVNNAQRAGAVGVVMYQSENVNSLFPPIALDGTGIPLAFIRYRDGIDLKAFLAAHTDRPVILDTALVQTPAEFDTIAYFSSYGPATADMSLGEAPLKPDLVAVGTDLYTATQTLDPSGDLYDSTGFAATQGTSFAVPMVAGAAALVKQKNPSYTAGMLKSAVVNTANPDLFDIDGPAPVTGMGAGKLDAERAVQVRATAEPSSLSFGVINEGSLPKSLSFRLTNTGGDRVTFEMDVERWETDGRANLTVIPPTQALDPGQSASISVRLEGNRPDPGSYSGLLHVRGGGQTLDLPYLYLVGDGVPFNAVPLFGDGFLGAVGESDWLMGFKLTDRYGVPVRNQPVTFRVISGGGGIDQRDETTDVYGIAAALVTLGPQLGEQQFEAQAGPLIIDFFGRARLQPAIQTVVNAASFETGQGLQPGSYVTITGRGLSEAFRAATTLTLPVSLAGVSVSFDAPSAGLSLPGRLHFVSDGQVNVQVPWEFAGLNEVLMKVSIGPGPGDASAVFRVPLAKASPGFFEYVDPDSGRRLIAALDQDFRLLTVANPARRGRVVQLYANGLGPVNPTVGTGEPTPSDVFVQTTGNIQATIGNRPASIQFAGLAPGIVGLYQVNVLVPEDAPTGLQDVVLTVEGIQSKAATLMVQ